MIISDLDKYFQLLKITEYKIGEFCPPAVLSRKWFAQRTQVRFRHHFSNASQVTKFLSEKCGLNTDS